MIDIKKEIRIRFVFLCLAISVCTILVCHFKYQLDYDRFHSKGNRIYKLESTLSTPGEQVGSSVTSYAAASRIESSLNLVEKVTRLSHASFQLKSTGLRSLTANGVFADASVFEIFDFPLVKGNAKSALQKPFTAVLTEQTAADLFGDKDAVGEVFYVGKIKQPVRVTGVARNLPGNSQIAAGLFISMPTLAQRHDPGIAGQMEEFGVITYLLFKGGTSGHNAQASVEALFSHPKSGIFDNLLTRKQMRIEPLRTSYFNPLLSRFQVFAWCASLISLLLALLESINSFVRMVLLQISLGDDYQTITSGDRNRKLIRRVCLLVLLSGGIACVSSFILAAASDFFFDAPFTGNFTGYAAISTGILLLSLLSSILISLWIVFRIPTEPMRTYLINKKSR
ncbi:ABC transporter permease [Dyadobacter crusticola]|uniref:ABC transporter permease n=1 Tax=Dyadobacter crusticola TaxID=292407 RepID=UPI0004E1D4C2|nr:ABC transporter permease [Dyadobacter crusticola]